MNLDDSMKVVSKWGEYLASNKNLRDSEFNSIYPLVANAFVAWAIREGFNLQSYLTGEDYDKQRLAFFGPANGGDGQAV